MKLTTKIAVIAVLPFIAFVALAVSAIHSNWAIVKSASAMKATGVLFKSASELVHELQKERGKSAMFLAGTASRSELDGQRRAVDEKLSSFRNARGSAGFDGAEVERSLELLPSMRRSAEAGEAARDVIAKYTVVIKALLGIEVYIARSSPIAGFETPLLSITLLETAKESLGRLRATVSNILSVNKPVTRDMVGTIDGLKAGIDVSLVSPALVVSTMTRQRIDAFHGFADWQKTAQVYATVILKAEKGGYGEDPKAFFTTATNSIDTLAEIVKGELDEVDAKTASAQAEASYGLWLIMSILVTLSMVMIVLSVVIYRSINRIILSLITETDALVNAATAGSLSSRGDPQKISFEFRPIIEGFNRVLDAVLAPIQDADRILKKLSTRDLTARVTVDYHGDHAIITNNLNAAAGNLQGALVQVAQATEEVRNASTQISSGSQSLAQGASEQAASLEEISSSIEEISSMVRQNMENANQANILAGTAQERAVKGKEAMHEMQAAIAKIKASADETAKIVKTIDEIAFQTNLLALNAAVEAARAGDAGRGFAVVAEEVRNLAQKSAVAAKNTSALIEGSLTNAKQGVSVSEQVGESLVQIVDGVQKVAQLVAEVSAAATEQTKGIEQVNQGIMEMNKVTQQNASLSEQSASASEELNAQAVELARMLGGFTLHSSTLPSAGTDDASLERQAA